MHYSLDRACSLCIAAKRRPIMLKILPIMLLSRAQNVAYHCMLNIMLITTEVIPQFINTLII